MREYGRLIGEIEIFRKKGFMLRVKNHMQKVQEYSLGFGGNREKYAKY